MSNLYFLFPRVEVIYPVHNPVALQDKRLYGLIEYAMKVKCFLFSPAFLCALPPSLPPSLRWRMLCLTPPPTEKTTTSFWRRRSTTWESNWMTGGNVCRSGWAPAIFRMTTFFFCLLPLSLPLRGLASYAHMQGYLCIHVHVTRPGVLNDVWQWPLVYYCNG